MESFGIYRGIYDRGPFWPSGATENKKEERGKETLGLGQRAARYQSIRGEECESPHWRVDKFLSTWKNASFKRQSSRNHRAGCAPQVVNQPESKSLCGLSLFQVSASRPQNTVRERSLMDHFSVCIAIMRHAVGRRKTGWRYVHPPIYPLTLPLRATRPLHFVGALSSHLFDLVGNIE